ncbi:MAG: hypothetical protein WAU91_03440, partial [Desulfatitalea sp.]
QLIMQIARDVAPRYIVTKKQPRPSEVNLLDRFYSQINSGEVSVALKNSAIRYTHKSISDQTVADLENNDTFDLMQLARSAMERLKKIYGRMVHLDSYSIDKVYNIPDDNPPGVALVKFDPSSVQTHTTGWQAWDKPFEVRIFGAFKALVAFNLAKVLRFDNSALFAALAGYRTEDVQMEYNMTAKSMIGREWYGSYCLRFNFAKWSTELAWVKYKKSGPEQRYLIELQRSERIVQGNTVLYSNPAMLIKPFVTMNDFLVGLDNSFQPPEHDINSPVRIN